MTWADDDSQFTTWGDGGGFGGTNSSGRVSLGVAVVTGTSSDFVARNIYGSPINSQAEAAVTGKSYGIIALGDTLYMWVSPGSNVENLRSADLFRSVDGAVSWSSTSVRFDGRTDGLAYPTFLQAGRDYSLMPDGFVYIYATRVHEPEVFEVQRPGELVLLRVPRGDVGSLDAYVFFGGLDEDSSPIWADELMNAEPAFTDPNGVLRTSATYLAGLDRFLLFSDHTETHSGNLAVFEGPTPWGPWHLIARWYNWRVDPLPPTSFFWNIAPKWVSSDGTRFTLVFSGTGGADGWNSVDAELVLRPPPESQNHP